MSYVPQTYDVELYETLHALSQRANRSGYNPEHLTPERIAVAKAAGLVKGRKHFALTWEGHSRHTDLHREHRAWECAEGDAADAAVEAAL